MSYKNDSDSDDTFIIGENTHKKLREARHKDGYRDGITDGQEFSLQEGFNKGYTIGYSGIYEVARLRGILWTLTRTNGNPELSPELSKKFQDSENQLKSIISSTSANVESIRQVESQVVESLKNCFFQECKKLNLIDEESAMKLFLSAIN